MEKKTKIEHEYKPRAVAQKLDYAKIQEILLQNVGKSKNKTFTQYTKDLIKNYIKNPYTNINNIRNVSAFLARTSMIYKKILSYYAQMPLFSYNLIYKSDFSKGIDSKKFLKNYQDILLKLQQINFKKEFSTAIATALRDGVYYGFVYDGEGDGFFIYPLDPQYCKISAINGNGEYVIAFDATYFDIGDNDEYLYGVNDDGEGTWDTVFIDGYETYKSDGNDYRWFDLPQERTLCLLADEEADMPLPYFLPVFVSLLDLIDLEQILMSKTELENYVLLLSKIPLITNTQEVDDFAVSLELIQYVQQLLGEVVPNLVGLAYSPCDLEVVNFNQANNADDTNKLSQSMSNLFSNLGISELVVSSGSSSNSVGLRHSIQNDESIALKYLNRLQNWVNNYIKLNYSEDFIFKFHPYTYFSQEEYVNRMKDASTLGIPVAMDYATSLGSTPYEVMCATFMENTLGIKDGLWKPLATSYTQSTQDKGGAPTKSDDELSDEGIRTRDKDKNETTKANR